MNLFPIRQILRKEIAMPCKNEKYDRKEHNDYICSAFRLASAFAKTGQPINKILNILLQNENDILTKKNMEINDNE